MEQVESGIYSNHHPYWYTRFIGLCLQIGYLFSGDINVACAAYSVIQSLLMAACLAYGVVTLYQAGMPMWCSTTAGLVTSSWWVTGTGMVGTPSRCVAGRPTT